MFWMNPSGKLCQQKLYRKEIYETSPESACIIDGSVSTGVSGHNWPIPTLRRNMTYYKVVKVVNSRLFSYTYDENSEDGSIEYKPGKFVIPKASCGPLAVFDSIPSLKNFLSGEGWEEVLRIYECEIEESSERTIWDGIVGLNWHCDLPGGTVLADAVKLTRFVEEL